MPSLDRQIHETADVSSTLTILAGAALGAAIACAFFTPSGQRARRQLERWLDDLREELRRARVTADKARATMDEGRRSFSAAWDAASPSTPFPFEEKRGVR